ncbi:oligosaccharide flippase family protein [Vibrio parahaemolyticus]|nr:oligosaccharide flippase family protein [Vibrio parahaemolyticus]
MASENLKNTIYSLLSNLVNIAFPLLIIPIIIDSFGLSGYGYFATILSSAVIISLILDLGFTQGIPKHLLDNRITINKAIKLIVLSKMPLILISSIIVLYVANKEDAVFIIFISISLTFSLEPIMYGAEKYRKILSLQLICKSIYCVMVLFIFFFDGEIYSIFISYGSSYLLLNVLYFFSLINEPSYDIDNRENNIEIFKDCLKFHFSKMFVNVYQQSSVFFVSIFNGHDITGVYSLGNQLYKVAQSIIGSIAKVSYTNMLKNRNLETLMVTVKTVFICYFLGFIVVLLFGEYILNYIFDSSSYLYISCLVFYSSLSFVILSSFFGYPYLTPIGKEKYSHMGLVLSSCTYFFLFLISVITNETSIITFSFLILIADFSGAMYRTYYSIKYRNYYEFEKFKKAD